MPVQKSNSTVTIIVNKMGAINKTVDSKSTGSEGYTSIDVPYIVQCMIHRSDTSLISTITHSATGATGIC